MTAALFVVLCAVGIVWGKTMQRPPAVPADPAAIAATAWVPDDRPGALHVVVLAGQSNIIGRSAAPAARHFPPGTLQLGRFGYAAGRLVPAAPPLDHHDPWSNTIGPALAFTEAYVAAHPGARVVLIPAGKGATGMVSGDWVRGGPLYADLVARVNGVMRANPGATLAAILWHQGEEDAFRGDGAGYARALDGTLRGLREDLDGAGPETPIVVGEMVYRWVENGANRRLVQEAIASTPSRLPFTAVASAAGLTPREHVHFDMASTEVLGQRYAAALAVARRNVPRAPQRPGAPEATVLIGSAVGKR